MEDMTKASQVPEPEKELFGQDDIEKRLAELDRAVESIDRAYSTGRVDRAKITQAAQLDAAEAVAMAGIAMESDAAADEATRIVHIAEDGGDRTQIRNARKNAREARKRARADHRVATKSARNAFNAIRFSSPNKLGFMRVVQVAFGVHIALVLIMLMLTSRDAVIYSTANLLDWLMIILEGVAFWFFINRYKMARPFVIGIGVTQIIVSWGASLLIGTFNLALAVFNSAFAIFLIIYMTFSKRVRAVLVNDMSQHTGVYDGTHIEIRRYGWPYIRNLIMYFIMFSVLGHWMEMAMCQLIIMGLVQGEYDPTNTMLWRDWLYPFPMEGAAVVLIALFMYPLKEWLVKKINNPVLPYVVSFLANALLCSLIEFSMGLIVNADHQLWDYTNNFGNIMGQVCLQNTLAFGVAASLVAWFIYPFMERWIAQVPRDIMNIVFIVVVLFGGIIWSLYIVAPPDYVDFDASEVASRQEQAEQESSNLLSTIDLNSNFIELLEDQLQDAEHLSPDQKNAIEREIDTINQSLSVIDNMLANPEQTSPSQ